MIIGTEVWPGAIVKYLSSDQIKVCYCAVNKSLILIFSSVFSMFSKFSSVVFFF